ncbi:diacylglycerol kinase [Alteromonas lipolytica]|uniref:Diacylglycerol kinase n=1 Tax=Alteromonas lipolytica TaxID=1856405 RepID=A0A1E8FHW4_9ALTE|nr:diacylglycerol kinase [Alteromonas lipolytica]OFI35208.1 diacylglycerol kinase [Alteromonas lipolytica]GGF57627.1 diacylglycerol kinase [Alteromonas lipolytica]
MFVTKVTGYKRLYYATMYSLKGLKAAFLSEPAIRQEMALLVVGTGLSLWLDVSGLERLIMIGSILLIIIVELLNSAIEAVVDRIGPEIHELSGKAKDIGSAAVFMAIVLMLVCWGTITYPLVLQAFELT